jgi:hypothetical protein
MRKSRFSDGQMVVILREADRSSVAEAARKNKVSEPAVSCPTNVSDCMSFSNDPEVIR